MDTLRFPDDDFKAFALGLPHEAAEMDFPRFAAFVRERAPRMTDDEIRGVLKETASDGQED